MHLQLTFLGGFEARLASGARVEFASRKAEALLAYLAFAPGVRHSREKLADLLWSDRTDEHARNSLRQSLTALRKALAEVDPSPIMTERDMVALDAEAVEVDAVRFEALVVRGSVEALEQACELYRGELLDQFASGEPVFENWLGEERRRLHDLMISALSQLLTHKAGSAQSNQAIAVAQRLLALDPLQEAVHRTLMKLYAECGHREVALKQYETCRQVLEDELGIEPEAETDELLEAIREGCLVSRDLSQTVVTGLSPPGAESAQEQAPLAAHAQAPRRTPRPWPWVALSAALVLVVAGGLVVWLLPREPGVELALEANMIFPLPDRPSIAVMPFDNLGDDPKQDYFADGMTEDLITDLAKLDGLFVMARNTVFTYKNKPVTVKQVAEELGVRYVLEGSVRRSETQLRINAQLVDALTGFHLWADRFDGSLENVFAFQDEISRKIVNELAVNLSPEEEAQKARATTDNPEAYDAFLRGWGLARVESAEAQAKAIPHLEKAIELDPNYGRAYAALAEVYRSVFAIGRQKTLGLTQKEIMDLATRYLKEALKDPTPLAHSVATSVHYMRGEYEESIASAERAIALGAKHPWSYGALAKAMLYAGQPAEALENIDKAARIDPKNPAEFVWRRGQILFSLGRFEESAKQFEIARDAGDDWTDTHMFLAACNGYLGRKEEAKAEIQQIRTMEKNNGWSYSVLSVDSWSYQREEDRERFREGLRKAGLDEIPWGYDSNSPSMIRGDDLRSLYFGRTIKGTDAQSGKERTISISKDGKVTSRIGDLVDTGLVDGWHDEKLCIRWAGEGRVCAVTFRNPAGTAQQFNEYDYVYFGGVIPFSPLDR